MWLQCTLKIEIEACSSSGIYMLCLAPWFECLHFSFFFIVTLGYGKKY